MVKKAKQLNSSLTEIEKALYQTKNRSRQDPLNFPIKLTNKLGHLNSLVTSNDFPPTNQDELVRKELTAEVEKHILKYKKLISQDLQYFNEEFASLNIDVPLPELKFTGNIFFFFKVNFNIASTRSST